MLPSHAFLRKPLDAGQVLATIERVLSDDEKTRQSARHEQVERLASLRRVTGGVGHAINNPLAFAQLNLDFVHDRLQGLKRAAPQSESAGATGSEALPDSLREDIRGIDGALADARVGLDRIGQIVRNLQRLSRVTDRDRRALNLETVLDESIDIARHQLKYPVRVTKRYGHVPAAEGDALALGQAFLNLLVNAAQAIRPGAGGQDEIAISTTCDATNLVVEISDTGQGIAPDVMPHIFDPFFTTKEVNEGTGLGLAISSQIVRDHGGRLTVFSEPGRGTVCRVYLPSPEPFAPATASLSSLTPVGERREVRGRVLVIDDEPMIGQVIANLLSPRHDVVAVRNAWEAFGRLDQGERFDLVLCDLLMPDIGGPEVHDAVVSRWPSLIPNLVIMTGGAVNAEATAFLARTRCAILYKPFVAQELEDLIEARLKPTDAIRTPH